MKEDRIKVLVGVKEDYQTSTRIMELLNNPKDKANLFDSFLNEDSDLSYDWFTKYFQDVYSDRKDKKQDFTPKELTELASKILGDTCSNIDLCAGTGGLTIRRWIDNKNSHFYMEELSDAAIPFLLFNCSIRNMNAVIRHGDTLHQEFKTTYVLERGERYSSIKTVDNYTNQEANTVIMNPPFSMKWERDKSYVNDPRFKDYGLAPTSKSDYALLLSGLSKLSDNGTLVAFMSPGILFRNAGGEGDIRKNLILKNYIDMVIQLPEKTFLKTTTPVILIVLKKNKETKDILFIDASDECDKSGKQNVLKPEHIENMLNIYKQRKNVDKLSHVATESEIKENDFNLNIPRYVDMFEEEPEIDLYENFKAIQQIDKEIELAEVGLQDMIKQLVASTPETQRFLQEVSNVN